MLGSLSSFCFTSMRSIMKPYYVAICAVLLLGCNHTTTGVPTQTAVKSLPTPPLATESPLLTVGQLRQDMLAYNLKPVRVKALIVDFGDGAVSQGCEQAGAFGSKAIDANITSDVWDKCQNTSSGWIIADDLGSYFTSSNFTGTKSGHLLVQPAVPTVHYLDYVEIDGVYDANANTIQATKITTTSHYAGVTK